ncbi:MAG: PIN domain-containing protein [Neisseriaceae bacterium]|nr:PIN domain-containing protein [Neisseriaceae bacterium]
MKYMFDTNAFSALMKNNTTFKKHLNKHLPEEICMSSIAWAEVRYGVRKSGSAKWLQISEILIKDITIVPFNKQTAETYATLRADLEKQGKNLSPLDMEIAACAVANDCILVTNDQAFHHLELKELPVEDWTV